MTDFIYTRQRYLFKGASPRSEKLRRCLPSANFILWISNLHSVNSSQGISFEALRENPHLMNWINRLRDESVPWLYQIGSRSSEPVIVALTWSNDMKADLTQSCMHDSRVRPTERVEGQARRRTEEWIWGLPEGPPRRRLDLGGDGSISIHGSTRDGIFPGILSSWLVYNQWKVPV